MTDFALPVEPVRRKRSLTSGQLLMTTTIAAKRTIRAKSTSLSPQRFIRERTSDLLVDGFPRKEQARCRQVRINDFRFLDSQETQDRAIPHRLHCAKECVMERPMLFQRNVKPHR